MGQGGGIKLAHTSWFETDEVSLPYALWILSLLMLPSIYVLFAPGYFMMETIPNEIFLNIQEELGNDSEKEAHQIFFIFSIFNFSIMLSFPKYFF